MVLDALNNIEFPVIKDLILLPASDSTAAVAVAVWAQVSQAVLLDNFVMASTRIESQAHHEDRKCRCAHR